MKPDPTRLRPPREGEEKPSAAQRKRQEARHRRKKRRQEDLAGQQRRTEAHRTRKEQRRQADQKKAKHRSGGKNMKPAPPATAPRSTPRAPQPRTVYEVARRKDGKAQRAHFVEARDAANLAAELAAVLGLDADASKAAAFVLEAGAAIVANDWQGRRIGRMVYEPDAPALARRKGTPKEPAEGEAPPAEQPAEAAPELADDAAEIQESQAAPELAEAGTEADPASDPAQAGHTEAH